MLLSRRFWSFRLSLLGHRWVSIKSHCLRWEGKLLKHSGILQMSMRRWIYWNTTETAVQGTMRRRQVRRSRLLQTWRKRSFLHLRRRLDFSSIGHFKRLRWHQRMWCISRTIGFVWNQCTLLKSRRRLWLFLSARIFRRSLQTMLRHQRVYSAKRLWWKRALPKLARIIHLCLPGRHSCRPWSKCSMHRCCLLSEEQRLSW